MAEKKNTKQKRVPSGFDAPVYGKMMPKGTTLKPNADGTVTAVTPKKKTAKK